MHKFESNQTMDRVCALRDIQNPRQRTVNAVDLCEKLDAWVSAKRIRDFATSDRLRSELLLV